MNIKEALNRVVAQLDLSTEEMQDVMREIMTGQCSEAQIGAFLMGMRMKSETIDGRVTDAVLLQPLVPGEFQFRRATLWFDRTDGLPRRIQTDEGPQTRTVDLANLRTNGTFPAGTFVFRVPSGVKVVDQ